MCDDNHEPYSVLQDRKHLIDAHIIKTRREPYFLGPESRATSFVEYLSEVLGASVVKDLGVKEVSKVSELPQVKPVPFLVLLMMYSIQQVADDVLLIDEILADLGTPSY